MLSLPHLIVLFVIALVVFGPEKLPELARMLGKATAEFRKMTSDFRYALEDEVRDLERQNRIRDTEIASAVRAAQSSPPVPDGTVQRALPSSGEESPVAAKATELAARTPEAPKAHEAVATSPEKASDDNPAV